MILLWIYTALKIWSAQKAHAAQNKQTNKKVIVDYLFIVHILNSSLKSTNCIEIKIRIKALNIHLVCFIVNLGWHISPVVVSMHPHWWLQTWLEH